MIFENIAIFSISDWSPSRRHVRTWLQ